MTIARGVLLGAFLLVLPATAFSQADQIARRLGLGKPSGSSDSKIAAGLKEALRVGADSAVKIVGQRDGYFGNEVIKILMPANLRPVEKTLRVVGYGPKVDGFVLSMNRAAEAAAPAAKKIFGDAILSMSFEDAQQIFSGGDTAATDYFKSKTSAQLTAAFRPVVEKTMNENGVAQQYNSLLGRAQSIPFMKSQSLDITQYVVSKALDGLFFTLGQEERKIRRDPIARTTSLLKEVFGK
jgi:hypothetical protein